jgi:hypothetical protein
MIDRLQVRGTQAAAAAAAAARKVALATSLDAVAEVVLGVGEDEEVLTALGEIRGGRGLGQALTRLENALRAKIDADG